VHGEEEASSEVLEFFRKQGANGGKIGVKRSLETMTPKKRTAPRQKASDAAVAARKEKRQSVKRDRGKNVTSESGASRRYGECLLVAEFSGALDVWFEQLRLKRYPDGSVTLSSVGREVLANGREGRRLLPVNDDAVITVSPGNIDEALSWLSDREWDRKPGFESAKREIVTVLKRKSTSPT